MAKGLSLSVILPAYNEEENITVAVERALEALPRIVEQFEVIIVNDGSRDGTEQVSEGLVTKYYPRVRLVNHINNAGYGAALRTGFNHARNGLLFFMDSDNQFDLSELQYFVPMMKQYDLVTGFRVYRYDPVLRCIISWLWNRVAGVLFRLHVRDVDCAFKLMRREVWEKVNIECNNFFASTELLARARKWNFRIAEKGVRHYPRMAGETTVQASDIPKTLREVSRMWLRIYFPSKKQMRAMSGAHSDRSNAREFVPVESPEGVAAGRVEEVHA